MRDPVLINFFENKDMKTYFLSLVVTFVIITAGIKSTAQDDGRKLLKQVARENLDAVYAISMYPRETRTIIFTATEYPEIIAKLSSMQKNSQEAFEQLVSSLSKDDQEKIWNLTRYDGLIEDLSAKDQMSADEINDVLYNYPVEIRQTAVEVRNDHDDLLVQIARMNATFNSDFDLLLAGYPAGVDSVFHEMIKMPEVLDLLFDHMQYTVVVGDYFKKNPERVLHKTDSINLVLTQKKEQESADWKQSLSEDPQVQEEFSAAAKDYAQENGYQPDDYNAPLTQDATNYPTNPYSWWYGYPSWYPYDYWVPYPYWYDWGFYFGPGGRVIFFGLPSAYFMEWFFYYPEHCYKYAELSSHYYNYYNRHRESMNHNTICHTVNGWRIRNKAVVTADWDKDKTGRVQRFREYGKMETERTKYNTKNPKEPVDQTVFVQKEQKKFPILARDVEQNQLIEKDKAHAVQEKAPEPVRTPPVKVPENYKIPVNEQGNTRKSDQHVEPRNTVIQKDPAPVQQQNTAPVPQPGNNVPKQRMENVNVQQRNSNPPKQTENTNQIRNAREYHQNTWNQIQPQSQPKPQPSAQPQQQQKTPPAKQQEHRQVQQPVKQNTPEGNKKK